MLRRVALLWMIATAALAQPADRHDEQVLPALVPSPIPSLVVGEVRTPRFRVLYTQRSEGAARALAERLEGIRDDIRDTLDRDWPGTTEVRVGIGRPEVEALALPGGAPPPWAVALAYPAHDIVLFEGASLTAGDGLQTLRHELVHVALGRLGRGWPRWFQEGVAMHLSGERSGLNNYTALFRAVRQDRVYRLDDLAFGWPEHAADVEIAYAQSEAFVAFLLDRHGPAALGALIDEFGKGATFEVAFARALKTTVDLEEQAFKKVLPIRYAWLPFTTTGSILWIGAALITVAGFVRRRIVLAKRLEEMKAEDEAEDAARRLLEAEADSAQTFGEPPLDEQVRGPEDTAVREKPTLH